MLATSTAASACSLQAPVAASALLAVEASRARPMRSDESVDFRRVDLAQKEAPQRVSGALILLSRVSRTAPSLQTSFQVEQEARYRPQKLPISTASHWPISSRSQRRLIGRL